jgi:hypothetical protein
MNEVLDQLLNNLLLMKHAKISDIKLEGNKLSFLYLGGRFYVIKKVIENNPEIGVLSVFHDTTLGITKLDLIKVPDFYITACKQFGFIKTRMKNYLKGDLLKYITLDANGFFEVFENKIDQWFPTQFEAKMFESKFEIYPI